MPKSMIDKIVNNLKKMDYDRSVFKVEIQAYIGESYRKDICDTFKLKFEKVEPYNKKLKKVFKKYANQYD
jgi:hypothetical protein